MVVLGGAHLVEHELHRLDLVHRVEQLAQNPALLQDFGLEQQLFAARARLVDQDGRVDALFGHATVQVDFAVAGALELFVDHFVHAAAGIHQRGADNGERATFFDVAGRAEEALGALQGVGVHAARQHLARRRQDVVVGASQTRDRVQQDHHVFLEFDQALGALDHHFGDLNVALGRLVEGGTDDFAAHGALHFGHFFRALVHQQHDQVDVRVIGDQSVGQVLHQHRLAALGRGDDQGALAFADGGDQVDDAAADVVVAAQAVAFKLELLVGEQRREVLEHQLVLVDLRRQTVDAVDLDQGKVALAILGHAHFAFDQIAGVQVEAAHLTGRQVDVVGAGQKTGVEGAQKAEAVGKHFEDAVAEDLLSSLGALLHDGKHQLLLAHARDVFNFKSLCHLDQLGDVQCLQF